MDRAPAMHPDQLPVDDAVARRLLAGQFPEHAQLPLRRVPSWGTDNAIFQLGGTMTLRVPIRPGAGRGIEREYRWLSTLAPQLPVPVPRPLALGRPSSDHPEPWSVLSWLHGTTPRSRSDGALDHLADGLAAVVQALQRIDPAGAPPVARGPVATADGATRAALDELPSEVDSAAATAVWEEAVAAEAWSGPPVWAHGDLLPNNLLLAGGRLAGVIDFGTAGVGDPACDLMIAWHLLSPAGRQRFRETLGVDDATWTRGRGWALAQGLVALAYYRRSNPGMTASSRHVVSEVLADRGRRPAGA